MTRRLASAVTAGPVATDQQIRPVVVVLARAHHPLLGVARHVMSAGPRNALALRAARGGLVQLLREITCLRRRPLREGRFVDFAPRLIVVAAPIDVRLPIRVLTVLLTLAGRDPLVLRAETLAVLGAPADSVVCRLHDERLGTAAVRSFVTVDTVFLDANHRGWTAPVGCTVPARIAGRRWADIVRVIG